MASCPNQRCKASRNASRAPRLNAFQAVRLSPSVKGLRRSYAIPQHCHIDFQPGNVRMFGKRRLQGKNGPPCLRREHGTQTLIPALKKAPPRRMFRQLDHIQLPRGSFGVIHPRVPFKAGIRGHGKVKELQAARPYRCHHLKTKRRIKRPSIAVKIDVAMRHEQSRGQRPHKADLCSDGFPRFHHT